MDPTTKTHLDNLWSTDKAIQNEAFFGIIQATDQPVDWAYDVWDEMVENLTHKDNHRRAIASQLLCNLAKSDPQNRILQDFDALLQVTRDHRFVTARHCLQNLWKVGVAGKPHQQMLLDGLQRRFHECITEKNCTLIRYDIIQGLKNLHDQLPDDAVHGDTIRQKALALIETEQDPKYRKKYARVWK